jgi:acetyl esterase/lipase
MKPSLFSMFISLAVLSIPFNILSPAASAGKFLERLLESRRDNQNQWSSSSDNFKLLRNISYGDDPAHRMDVYLPPDPASFKTAKAPVIFMVHGGGWKRGDKSSRRVAVNKVVRWVPKGFIFISANNRLRPVADPIQQADDIALALAKAQKSAASWGADPDRFLLMGHSAGAHLIALLNADPDRALNMGARPWLGAVSLDSGAMNVPEIMEKRHARLYDQAFGDDPGFWKAASPFHALTTKAKPFLLVCSAKRRAACAQTDLFAARAESFAVPVQVLKQPLSHGEINEQLGLDGEYTEAVEKFISGLDPVLNRLLAP